MSDQPSMQDIIRRRRASGFVGRTEQLGRFQENLALRADDPRHRFLFNVHGLPGTGKTFLLRQFQQVALDSGARCALVDERVADVPGAMAAIASQLRRQGGRLRAFERRHQHYEQRLAALVADQRRLSGASLLLTRLALQFAQRLARGLPVVGLVADAVDADAAVETAENLHSLLTRALHSREDARLVLAPTEELTPLFVRDLRHVASRRPLALFFDDYEHTGSLLDAWLYDLVDGRPFGDLPGSLTITVAGRDPLDAHRWAGMLTEIVPMELRSFTDAEARQLLAGKGVDDEAVISAIFALSGRLPLLVATLAEGSPIDPAALVRPGGEAIEQFVRWQTDGRGEVTMLAALPRWLDEDCLAALTGADEAAELYGWLRGLPFVLDREGVCRYHEVVRTRMLRLLRERSPMRWRRSHRKLADLHRDQRRGLELSDLEGWADATWQRHALEETYHRLCAAPLATLPSALVGALHAYRTGRPLARLWAEMVRQAGEDADATGVARWGAELSASAGRDEDCWTGFLTALLDRASLEPAERALALGQRAECHVLDRRFDQALADFGQAVVMDPSNADLAVARGQALRIMGRYEEALRELDRAIELAPDSEVAIAYRGVILRRLGRFEESAADLSHAVALRPDDAWAVAHRGETHRLMGRSAEAIADFSEAVRLNPDYDWALASRGVVLRQVGRLDESRADLDRTVELSPDFEWAWAQRGITHRRAGRYDLAISDLTRAVELEPEYARALADRGVTLRQVGRYEEAAADLDRAVGLDPANVWMRVNHGITLRQAGRYEAALASLDEAVARRPEDAWAVGNRGETLRLLGRDREALADLDRALELQPDRPWTLARRGEARRRLGDREGALADFDRALALDAGDGTARFGRALLLLGGGRRSEAATELEAAVAAGRRSLEARPGDPAGLLRLAVYEAASGRPAAAPPLFREALERGAGGGLVAETIRELRELAAVADGEAAGIERLVGLLSAPAREPDGGA
jgi:tetratricopeptide (TPR) repeat protein